MYYTVGMRTVSRALRVPEMSRGFTVRRQVLSTAAPDAAPTS
jgi:hypothetical protein